MTDLFQLLNQPRRPWINPETLKETFLALSEQWHPDRKSGAPPEEIDAANRRYAELNRAFVSLRDPKQRLRHLLELETGSPPNEVQTTPPEWIDLFMNVAQFCRATDPLIAKRRRETSPLLRVDLLQEASPLIEQGQCLAANLQERLENLETELAGMNPSWEAADAGPADQRRQTLPLQRLESIYRQFGYFGRWKSQIQERLLSLAI